MKNNKSLRALSFIVIGYMLLALLWWAILLHRKNTEVFVLKSDLLRERFMTATGVANVDVTTMPEFQELKPDYTRQMYMIFGEAVVFGITLVIGIYFINRAYNRELSSAEKQKNFLLSITHELKSPLASINLIFSTFIKRDLPNDKIKELSADGLKESTRLEELFNKILISTRLGQAYPFNFENANISDLISTSVDRFQNLHPEAELLKNVHPGILHNIDQESIVSVIKNLLENALKYSPDKKQIKVDLRKLHNETIIEVSDRGVGIPKEEREKIFDQFYRIGNEDTRASKGTGLGLYIVKQIVHAHKGKIKVTNNDGLGTKFIITL
ncbi:MAG: signal transduction histidine kinase [Halioglobus sp.]|jgi:signal transduction histidine kinase